MGNHLNLRRQAALTARRWEGVKTAATAHAVLSAALIASYAVLSPAQADARAMIYLVVGLVGILALLLGVCRQRPERGGAWCWLITGHVLWVLGDATYYRFLPEAGLGLAHLSSESLYLLGYPPIAAAAGLMMLHRSRGARLASSLDATMLVAGLALVVWVTIAQPDLHAPTSTPQGPLDLVFLFLDIIITTFMWATLTTSGGRTPAFALLVLAIGLQLVADTSYATTALTDLLSDDTANLFWMSSNALLGACALHPSMRSLTSAGRAAAAGLTTTRLVVLLSALLAVPTASYIQVSAGQGRDAVVVIASVTLVLLTVARMALALRTTVTLLRTTEQLRDEMAHQASHDPLTGLANRTQLAADLDAAIGRTAARSSPTSTSSSSEVPRGGISRRALGVGVLYIDLDGFKGVNDAFGHAAGDAVLREVARRLTGTLRTRDTAARQGGDEFSVVLNDVTSEAAVLTAAQRLVEHLAEPLIWQGRVLQVGASIGASITLDGETTAEVLLAEADAAAYRAKASGRGRVVLCDEAARASAAAHSEVEEALRHAVNEGELELHYQPVVHLGSREQHGCEALVRWRRADRTLTPPDAFIPVAEASDLVCDLGRWVLRQACEQLAAWTAAASDGDGPVVAVNISSRHLKQPGIVTDVITALQTAGARADRLMVEVTETVLIDSPAVIDHLRALRSYGVQVAIDDFGTGFTSIGQFEQLPADVVKIDRSLVASGRPQTAELVAVIIRAAHACGLTVVAEGIETMEQHHALLEAGAQLGQGWLFGRPQPLPSPSVGPGAPVQV